uniref:Uncharacterized protein n=1 Tax=termite gut metagenome TaxID=433724 RepID=S0DDZ4_9ZZZZ
MKDRGLDMGDIGTVLRSDVRLARCQLADLFGVYYGTITANIKAIIRSGAVRPSFEGTLVQVGNTVLPECYDMEMVIALAFRLNSPAAERIRRYIVQRMVVGSGKPAPTIFLSCGKGAVVN